MTLEQAAERTGLAVSTIYKIENGKVSPSFEICCDSHGAMVSGWSSSLSPDRSSTTQLTVRAPGRALGRGQGVWYAVLCNATGKKIIPLIGTISAAGDSVPPILIVIGEELLFVLEGEVELMVEHYEPVILGAGDYAYYDNTIRHGVLFRPE